MPLNLSLQAFADIRDISTDLGRQFAEAGHELAIVGGAVRDRIRQQPGKDLDFATSAHPAEVADLLGQWADSVWDVGIRFGTVGARKSGFDLEITTYRSEAYDPQSRKPHVEFGTSLDGDLARRDFTINAMAMRLPDFEFVDLFAGVTDLAAGLIRTPGSPADSFSDDPLRMMRAARFVSQLGFQVEPTVVEAITDLADRIAIVSAERVRDEFNRLLLGQFPRAGLELLVTTGLCENFLPELPALALEIDEHHRHKDVYEHSLIVLEQAIALETDHAPSSGPDLVLRIAALLHDIGKPKTRRFQPGGGVSFHHHEVVGAKLARKRLRALRYSNDEIDQICHLIELHLRFHGYSEGRWTDSAVRRYVRDAGDQLVQLHKLTRADCTTRNRRKAAALRAAYDDLEARIEELNEQEQLQSIRPDLDGNQIMQVLGTGPGPHVGRAYRFLLDRRLDRGPVDEATAIAELRSWWTDQSEV